MTRGREIINSYRRLYRNGLFAVHFSAPARYVLRDELRHAFRSNSSADFNATKIENTVKFLRRAVEEKGWAHRILKNLLHVAWWGGNISQRRPLNHRASQSELLLRQRAYKHFYITVNLFNENFGMCLPVRDFHVRETPASLDRRPSQNQESTV